MIRRLFRRLVQRLVLLVIILAAVGYWRPDWRLAAQRAAAPVMKRAAAPLIERVQAYRSRLGLGRGPAPSIADRLSPSGRAGTGPESPRSTPESGQDNPTRPEGQPEQKPGPPADRLEEGPVRPAGNLPPRLPVFRPTPPLPATLRALRATVERSPSAAGYRRLADVAVSAGFPDVGAAAYLQEARIYRRLGDPNAASVEELKAGRFRAEGRLFVHAPEPPAAELYTAARLEPPYGALLGAFIDRDDELPNTFMDENWQTHRNPEEFAARTGKQHASYFCYLRYGQPFPSRWAERLRDDAIIPHIAWEPRSLAEVADDQTLRRFAEALARFDAPIFIRFAGEMNGAWTPYHRDPALYRQKFRLVHRVLTRRAPKAALIWCVNNIPDAPIDAYYPGDDAVDWVGVNMYNVLYFDNDRSRPADGVHPADLLQAVYARYSRRKPIALCEYAASHQAAVDPRPQPEFAVTRMRQLYAALPRLFPRVKLVDWFNCNNLRHARPDRQLNDFSLTSDTRILRAYRDAVAPDYFLSHRDARPRETIRALRDNEPLTGVVTFSAWVRTHLDRPRVYLLADNQVLYAGDEPGAPVGRWDTRRVRPGTHAIRLIAADRDGRRILDERRTVRVAPNVVMSE
jgi:hypothetical protein